METGADERFITYDNQNTDPVDCVAPIKLENGNDYSVDEAGSININIGRDHNRLSGLQGGSANERYHVTRTISLSLVAAHNPSTNNPIATIQDIGDLTEQTPSNESFIMI